MLDNETIDSTMVVEDHVVHALNPGLPNLNHKSMLQTGDATQTDRVEGADNSAIIFPKDKSVPSELLSKEEEYDLAFALADAASAIALLTMTWGQSAKELLSIVNDAATTSLKKRLFSDESYYFALRKEMDDLVNTEGNVSQLKQLLAEAMTSDAVMGVELSPMLREYISNIDWPGPLMLTFAKRYGNKYTPDSTLERAINEYLFGKDVLVGNRAMPPAKHRSILDQCVDKYLDARERLVNHNVRLVLHIVKRYTQQSEYLPDLVQEGMCGLIRAAEKFRPSMGNRFSTYAHQWIRSKITTARANIDKIIPISHDYNTDIKRVSQWIGYQQATQSPIKFSKLSDELDISQQRLESIMQLKQQNVSLDQSYVDGEGLLLHAKIPDPDSDLMEKQAHESSKRYLSGVIKNVLSDREAYIINERFGRLNSDPKTLKQVSDILGLSCERVRQLEANALKKLRRRIDKGSM